MGAPLPDVVALELPGVLCVRQPVHRDRRGWVVEAMRAETLESIGVPSAFAQHNHSRSEPGVVRGMHWQRHPAQGKLVTVVRGRVWDVVAEVRPDRPHHGRHVGVWLEPGVSVWVPPGYAHGFAVPAGGGADVAYALTRPWRPGEGRGVRWDDPTLAIPWPVSDPILSSADAQLPTLDAVRPDDLPSVR